MICRPAVRAAIVVSGLSVAAACGGTATLRDDPSTPEPTGTVSSGSSNETITATREPCEPGAEATTEACCDPSTGATWDASSGRCVWMAVPGPFVPPAMQG